MAPSVSTPSLDGRSWSAPRSGRWFGPQPVWMYGGRRNPLVLAANQTTTSRTIVRAHLQESGERGGVAPVIAEADGLLETEGHATYRTICPLLTRMLARSAFHLNMDTVDDVEEILHHSHLLEQLLFSPLTILQQKTHVANLRLIDLNF